MPPCMFCLADEPKLTDEHVFMAAIGGDLVAKGSCVGCNNALNKAFEEKIAHQLAHFRRVLRTTDRKGNLPAIDITVEIDGENYPATLPDGTVQVKPIFTKTLNEGVQEITAQYFTEAQKERLCRSATERGWQVIQVRDEAIQVEGSFGGDLDFIDSPEMLVQLPRRPILRWR